MPLNIGASGSIKPYAKYNSKADKWFARGDEGDVEIGRPTFVADFANIATGWFRFREPQWHPPRQPLGQRPRQTLRRADAAPWRRYRRCGR